MTFHIGGMDKRTPMMVDAMQGDKSLQVCWSVYWSLEALMSVILHLTLHLAISDLNVSYVWGRSGHILSAVYHPAGQSVWKAISVAHSTDLHYPGCEFPFPELNGPGRHYTKWLGRNRTPFGHQGYLCSAVDQLLSAFMVECQNLVFGVPFTPTPPPSDFYCMFGIFLFVRLSGEMCRPRPTRPIGSYAPDVKRRLARE